MTALALALALALDAAGAPVPEAQAEAEKILARLAAGEPTVLEVQAAAAAQAGIDAGVLASWRSRARWAAVLPELSADYRHEERTWHVVGIQSGSEVDYLRAGPADRGSLRLSWDLREVVFARDELKVAAAELDLRKLREDVVRRATHLFFDRRRRQLELALAPPPTSAARAEQELEVAELTAELDALTGGLYARREGKR